MRESNCILFLSLLCLTAVACSHNDRDSRTSGSEEVPLTLLTEPQTIIAYDDHLLAQPYLLKFDHRTGNLFIYDHSHRTLLELNREGEILNEIGGEGEGPGELAGARDFFLTDDHIYIFDHVRFLMHRYDRNGDIIDAFDVVPERPERPADLPPSPPEPPFTPDFNNLPFITFNGHLMLPSYSDERSLYRLKNTDQEVLAAIGQIPEESEFFIDDDNYQQAVEARIIPPTDLHRAFPVQDVGNPDELFIVYSSSANIARYSMEGERLWVKTIPETHEVKRLAEDHYGMLDEMPPDRRYPLRKYVSGIADPSGGLYLATYTNIHTPVDEERSLFVHHLNAEGELQHRYELESVNDTQLISQVAIDFENRVMYALTFDSAELIAYSF